MHRELEHHDPRVLVDNPEGFYDGISLIHYAAKVDGVETVVENKGEREIVHTSRKLDVLVLRLPAVDPRKVMRKNSKKLLERSSFSLIPTTGPFQLRRDEMGKDRPQRLVLSIL
jgi:hypothetical protein